MIAFMPPVPRDTLYAPRGAQPPQYLPTEAQMDAALESPFMAAAVARQLTIRRQSVVDTWRCQNCREYTIPSRSVGGKSCHTCGRGRTAPEGPPRADTTVSAWRVKAREHTVYRSRA